MNQGNWGDFSNLDTETLLQHSPGVRFPAEKDQVAATAERNDAPRRWLRRSETLTPNASTAPTRYYRWCKGARAPSRNP
jgi:hypothetical protein